MIVPDGSDNDDKKSAPDYTGAIKIATAIVIGILTIVGFGWEDLIGKPHNTSVSSKKRLMWKRIPMNTKMFIWMKKFLKNRLIKRILAGRKKALDSSIK